MSRRLFSIPSLILGLCFLVTGVSTSWATGGSPQPNTVNSEVVYPFEQDGTIYTKFIYEITIPSGNKSLSHMTLGSFPECVVSPEALGLTLVSGGSYDWERTSGDKHTGIEGLKFEFDGDTHYVEFYILVEGQAGVVEGQIGLKGGKVSKGGYLETLLVQFPDINCGRWCAKTPELDPGFSLHWTHHSFSFWAVDTDAPYWSSVPLTDEPDSEFVEHGDGTADFFSRFVFPLTPLYSSSDPANLRGTIFEVNMHLTGYHSSTEPIPPGMPKIDPIKNPSEVDPEGWHYYDIATGEAVGVACLDTYPNCGGVGARFEFLPHFPGVQFGYGASHMEYTYGASGWYDYNYYDAQNQLVTSNVGDIYWELYSCANPSSTGGGGGNNDDDDDGHHHHKGHSKKKGHGDDDDDGHSKSHHKKKGKSKHDDDDD